MDTKCEMKSAAHIACENQDIQMLKFLKEQKFVDFNMIDSVEETPIYTAIKLGNIEIVTFLVEECGVNIEHREVQQRSPLYYSSSKGTLRNLHITKYLVSKGANVNAKTAMGRSALLKATWNG